jgi:hypothetical protein
VGNAKDQPGGAQQVKEPEWEMRGTNGCLKRKVFFKNQKHQPNIVEITHLCIMLNFVRPVIRPLSIRPVVHADGHPGSSQVAGCTQNCRWANQYGSIKISKKVVRAPMM